MEKIRRSINRLVRSEDADIWRLWSDEDDLVIVVDRILLREGEAETCWIDGSSDKVALERFSPVRYFSEKGIRRS